MVPYVIFGTLSGLSAILMITMPETLNAPLMTTLEEAEEYEDSIKKSKAARENPIEIEPAEIIGSDEASDPHSEVHDSSTPKNSTPTTQRWENSTLENPIPARSTQFSTARKPQIFRI